MNTIYLYSALLISTFSFGQKLFIVSSNKKFGLLNENGIEIISTKFSTIEDFDKFIKTGQK